MLKVCLMMAKELRAPIENIVFSRLNLSGLLQLRRRIYKPPLLLMNRAEESVKFGGIGYLQQLLKLKLSLVQHFRLHCRKRQIVSIVIRGWPDVLGFFQKRNGIRKSPKTNVELSKIVVQLVTPRIQLKGFPELSFRERVPVELRQICRQIRAGYRGGGICLNRGLEVHGCGAALFFGRQDQAQQFICREACRRTGQDALQDLFSFPVLAGVIGRFRPGQFSLNRVPKRLRTALNQSYSN